jgi:hypothetical protein
MFHQTQRITMGPLLLTNTKPYYTMFATFYYFLPFVRTLAKLGKATIGFYMSGCPQEQLDSHWTNFLEVLYCGVLIKLVERIQIWLKSDENKRHVT